MLVFFNQTDLLPISLVIFIRRDGGTCGAIIATNFLILDHVEETLWIIFSYVQLALARLHCGAHLSTMSAQKRTRVFQGMPLLLLR